MQVDELVLRRQLLSAEDKQVLMDSLQGDVRVAMDLDVKRRTASHKDLRGKCFKKLEEDYDPLFPPQTWYYMVISHKSRLPERPSVLCVPEFPYYWFDYNMKGPGAYYLGDFIFDGGIFVDDKFYADFDKMEEISREEFDAALDAYVQKLKKMPWDPNHNKYGGHFPHEPEWAPVP